MATGYCDDVGTPSSQAPSVASAAPPTRLLGVDVSPPASLIPSSHRLIRLSFGTLGGFPEKWAGQAGMSWALGECQCPSPFFLPFAFLNLIPLPDIVTKVSGQERAF